jgi:hypothetical protein
MSDILSAIGILLAIITLFFEKVANDIKPLLEKSIPPKEQESEIKKTKREIDKGIKKMSLFVFLYFFFAWLLLPTSFEIVSRSIFSIWNFDTVNTIYIVVNCTLIIFLIAAIKTLGALIRKRRKCLTTAST